MNSASVPAPVSDAASAPDIEATIELARQAVQRRDWLDAARWWDAVRSRSPDHAPAYVGAANALRQVGRQDEAERLLDAAAERFPSHEGILIALAGLATARRDWAKAIIRWEAARRQFPENPSCYLGAINALNGAQRSEDADALLPQAAQVLQVAQRRGVETIASLQLALQVAKARLDWVAARSATEAIVARETPSSPRTYLALAHACWHLRALDAADRAARKASELDPAMTQATIVSAWVATERGDGHAALKCYRRLVLLQPQTARWSLKLVQLLNRLGRVDEAVAELNRVCRRWPDHPMVNSFLKSVEPGSALARDESSPAPTGSSAVEADGFQTLINTAPRETSWKRRLLVPESQLEVQVAEVVGAETVLLVFTGEDDGLSIPLTLFDRYLAPLDVTAIYLKDFKRLLYMRGIRSLSDDYNGTLMRLRALVEKSGAKRLVTLGHCDGAFAAIRYGTELGAARILAAGPATHFPEEAFATLDTDRNFKRAHVTANLPPETTDLKSFLESRIDPAKIEIFFRQEDERERRHARRIARVPGARLHPIAGSAPAALHRLALSTENFHTVLGAWLGVPTRV